MKRTREVQKVIDNYTKKAFGKPLTKIIEQNICVICHNKVYASDFRDEKSKKEYSISGLCQKCQDDTFGG